MPSASEIELVDSVANIVPGSVELTTLKGKDVENGLADGSSDNHTKMDAASDQRGGEESSVSDPKTDSPIDNQSPAAEDTMADAEDGYQWAKKDKVDDEDTDDQDDNMEEFVAGLKGDADAEAEYSEVLSDAISQAWNVPDGGWGWVVVLSALMVSLIVDGLTYTFGIFLGELERVFEAPKSTIALASSLQVGIYLMVGPVVSALTNRFGCRPVIIAGSFVAGMAYIVSAWSPDVVVFIVTYGVIGGIGFGMMYLPAIVAVSVYFEEKRAIATGIAVCGSGIGTFILAPLTDLMIYEYNWSWTLLLQGALVLNGMIFGGLVRPLQFQFPNTRGGIGEDEVDTTQQGTKQEEVIFSNESKQKRRHKVSTSSSTTSRPETVPLITVTDDQDNTTIMLGNPESRAKPTDSPALFFSSTPNFVIDSPSQLSKAVSKKGSHKQSRTSSINSNDQASQRSRANTLERSRIASLTGSQQIPSRNRANTLDTSALLGVQRMQSVTDHSGGSGSSKVGAHAPLGLSFISVSDVHLNKIREDVHLPLSRRDIHLSGALAHPDWHDRIPRGEGLYIQSVRSISSLGKGAIDETGEKPTGLWACIPDSARDTLQEMLNLSILKDKSYWFVLLGNFFCMIGFYVPFVYIADRAKEIGIGEDKAAFLLSIIGITNTIGRVLTGVVMNFLDIDTIMVTSVALGIAGITTVLCPFCSTYWSLALVSTIFGVCVAAYISLCSVMLCELLGVENLTNAFGFVILFRGVACIMGPPIAGAIIDSTGIFDPAFFVGGGMIVLGALSHSFLLMPCARKHRSNPG